MCFLGFTRSQKGYKCFSPSLNRYFVFAYVIFIESSLYFKSLSSPFVSPFEQIHIIVVFDPLVMSSVPANSPPPPPLQDYSLRQSSHRALDESLLVLDPPSLLTPIIKPDIPISIRKGIHSTHNPSLHYNA